MNVCLTCSGNKDILFSLPKNWAPDSGVSHSFPEFGQPIKCRWPILPISSEETPEKIAGQVRGVSDPFSDVTCSTSNFHTVRQAGDIASWNIALCINMSSACGAFGDLEPPSHPMIRLRRTIDYKSMCRVCYASHVFDRHAQKAVCENKKCCSLSQKVVAQLGVCRCTTPKQLEIPLSASSSTKRSLIKG